MDPALASAKYIRLTTFRKDGRQVSTAVWQVPIGGKLYFGTSGDSGKVKRIRATRRVKVAPSDFRGNSRGPELEGTGRIVDDPALCQAARRDIAAKYGLWQRLVQLTTWIARDRNRVVVELSLSPQ